jgi:two-component system, response regulator
MTDPELNAEILLVEDNATDAELCMRALKKRNLTNRIVWAKDGSEALDFLFGEGAYVGRNTSVMPKVILLDLRMPKVGGLEVISKLKTTEHLKSIPIVVLTSSREDIDVKESYRLGANSFVSKPVVFEEFAEAVAKLGLYWLIVNKPPV